ILEGKIDSCVAMWVTALDYVVRWCGSDIAHWPCEKTNGGKGHLPRGRRLVATAVAPHIAVEDAAPPRAFRVVPRGEVIRRLDGRGFRSPDGTGLITTMRAVGSPPSSASRCLVLFLNHLAGISNLQRTVRSGLVDGSTELVGDEAADHVAIVLPVAGN